MKVYTFSEARQKLSEVLSRCRSEEVLIRRRGGEVYSVKPTPSKGSPFDVPAVKTSASTEDILAAIHEVRRRPASGKWKPVRRGQKRRKIAP